LLHASRILANNIDIFIDIDDILKPLFKFIRYAYALEDRDWEIYDSPTRCFHTFQPMRSLLSQKCGTDLIPQFDKETHSCERPVAALVCHQL
jgi:hypothetical protein